MEFGAAQRDMVAANYRGAPGVLVSGIVWLIAAGVWASAGFKLRFAALFVGGMLIMPLSLVIARALNAPKLATANPLTRLALESTFLLFAGILIAYSLLGRCAAVRVFGYGRNHRRAVFQLSDALRRTRCIGCSQRRLSPPEHSV